MRAANPAAPNRVQARAAAERIARALRAEMPEYAVRIEESIRCRFEVVVEVPFRCDFHAENEFTPGDMDG